MEEEREDAAPNRGNDLEIPPPDTRAGLKRAVNMLRSMGVELMDGGRTIEALAGVSLGQHPYGWVPDENVDDEDDPADGEGEPADDQAEDRSQGGQGREGREGGEEDVNAPGGDMSVEPPARRVEGGGAAEKGPEAIEEEEDQVQQTIVETDEGMKSAWDVCEVAAPAPQGQPQPRPRAGSVGADKKPPMHYYWKLHDPGSPKPPLGEEFYAMQIEFNGGYTEFPVFVKTTWTTRYPGGIGNKTLEVRDVDGTTHTLTKTDNGIMVCEIIIPGDPRPSNKTGSVRFSNSETRLTDARAALDARANPVTYYFDAPRGVFIFEMPSQQQLEVELPAGGMYVKLKPRNADVVGAKTKPQGQVEDIYIPAQGINTLPANLRAQGVNFFWARNSEGRPFRVLLSGHNDPILSNWAKVVENAIKSVGARQPERYINPPIALFLVPTNGTTETQLDTWVEAVQVKLNGYTKDSQRPVEVVAEQKARSSPYQKIGSSPFGHYDTYIRDGVLHDYLNKHKPYQFPTDYVPSKDPESNEWLDPHPRTPSVKQTYRTGQPDDWPATLLNKVDYRKIQGAKGTRRPRAGAGRDRVLGQAEVMGRSATRIAEALHWYKENANVNQAIQEDAEREDEAEDEDSEDEEGPAAVDQQAQTIQALLHLNLQEKKKTKKEEEDRVKVKIPLDKAGYLDQRLLFNEAAINVQWPQLKYAKSEWLHRSAYSWGSLYRNGRPSTAQVYENLIFGTSETNSLMTRFEKSWQRLVLELKISGTLTTTVLYDPISEYFGDGGADRDLQTWKNRMQLVEEEEEKVHWLCKGMVYHLKLDKKMSGIIQGDEWTTIFYPFQRPFFTKFERELDQYILTEHIKQVTPLKQ